MCLIRILICLDATALHMSTLYLYGVLYTPTRSWVLPHPRINAHLPLHTQTNTLLRSNTPTPKTPGTNTAIGPGPIAHVCHTPHALIDQGVGPIAAVDHPLGPQTALS